VGRLCAAFYDVQMRLSRGRVEPVRERVVAPAAGLVLELGVGTGLNLAHYGRGAIVIGVDPNPAMLELAKPRARDAPTMVRLVIAQAESLPFPDGTFDEVVATLVFCSVRSPTRALAEVERVLKPGGQLRFLEHVRSDNPVWARLQDAATPIWNVIADGCCPNRATVATMEDAGFAPETLDRFSFGLYPTRPMVLGTARRS
jgi:ubiquinone/menaquinone biosynthesis C-methylase UbiE